MNHSMLNSSVSSIVRSQGFTLIETLVVMMIFAVISVLTFQGFQAVINAHDRHQIQNQRTTKLQQAWSIIFSDFINIVARPSRDILGSVHSAYRTDMPDYSVYFTRGGLAPFGSQTSLRQVAYSLDEDGDLLRWTWPSIDMYGESIPEKQVLVSNVKSFNIKQLNLNGAYEEAWPPLNTSMPLDVLPRMIRISIIQKNQLEVTRYIPGVASLDSSLSQAQASESRFPLMSNSNLLGDEN